MSPAPAKPRKSSSGNERVEAFAVCAPGLEPFVAAELRKVGVASVVERHGGVSCTATWPQVWQLNLWSRCASRILVRIARFSAPDFADLEAGFRRIDWGTWLADDAVVSVSGASSNSAIYHTGAIEERALATVTAGSTLRVGASRNGSAEKAARLGDEDEDTDSEAGSPPAEETSILIRIVHDQVTVSLDTSGRPLYKRGWRMAVAKAPIRETLAAGLIAASEWDGKSPLIDPFCGSGTLLIEALLSARRMAPGRHRTFGFQSFPTFDAERWEKLLRSADADVIDRTPTVIGADRDAGAIAAARSNAERAGVGGLIEWREASISDLAVPTGRPGSIVANPPYGQRIGGVAPAIAAQASRVGGVGGVSIGKPGERATRADGGDERAPRTGSTGLPSGDRRPGQGRVIFSRSSDPAVEEESATPAAAVASSGGRPGRDTEADLRNLYDRWGQRVREVAGGWTVAVVAQPGPLLDRFASRAGVMLETRATTSNGGIPVVFARGTVPKP